MSARNAWWHYVKGTYMPRAYMGTCESTCGGGRCQRAECDGSMSRDMPVANIRARMKAPAVSSKLRW
eukprot:1159727-Pelagomonas_calceolata.AAC.5